MCLMKSILRMVFSHGNRGVKSNRLYQGINIEYISTINSKQPCPLVSRYANSVNAFTESINCFQTNRKYKQSFFIWESTSFEVTGQSIYHLAFG